MATPFDKPGSSKTPVPQSGTSNSGLLHSQESIRDQESNFEALDPAVLITHARKLSGLTQYQLAARAGTSQSAIARYENGVSSPSTDTLARILKANGQQLLVHMVPTTLSNLSSPRAKLIREKRGDILKLARKHQAHNVRVFGSVVRGEDDNKSDIDFLVDFDIGLSIIPIMKLKRELEELLNETVDVAPVALLKKTVLNNALKEALPL